MGLYQSTVWIRDNSLGGVSGLSLVNQIASFISQLGMFVTLLLILIDLGRDDTVKGNSEKNILINTPL